VENGLVAVSYTGQFPFDCVQSLIGGAKVFGGHRRRLLDVSGRRGLVSDVTEFPHLPFVAHTSKDATGGGRG
jgi:hypothetical protein